MELKWYNQLIIFNHICIHHNENMFFLLLNCDQDDYKVNIS